LVNKLVKEARVTDEGALFEKKGVDSGVATVASLPFTTYVSSDVDPQRTIVLA